MQAELLEKRHVLVSVQLRRQHQVLSLLSILLLFLSEFLLEAGGVYIALSHGPRPVISHLHRLTRASVTRDQLRQEPRLEQAH